MSLHSRLSLLFFCAACAGTALADALPAIELFAGFHRIEAEVASTQPTRTQGLMHRREMPQQRGMLFVFPDVAIHCMWMRNTPLPLAVAFLDESGRILNIEEMRPLTENNHCAARPARYALEMNTSWFSQRGIKRGDTIGGIERAPAAR